MKVELKEKFDDSLTFELTIDSEDIPQVLSKEVHGLIARDLIDKTGVVIDSDGIVIYDQITGNYERKIPINDLIWHALSLARDPEERDRAKKLSELLKNAAKKIDDAMKEADQGE